MSDPRCSLCGCLLIWALLPNKTVWLFCLFVIETKMFFLLAASTSSHINANYLNLYWNVREERNSFIFIRSACLCLHRSCPPVDFFTTVSSAGNLWNNWLFVIWGPVCAYCVCSRKTKLAICRLRHERCSWLNPRRSNCCWCANVIVFTRFKIDFLWHFYHLLSSLKSAQRQKLITWWWRVLII